MTSSITTGDKTPPRSRIRSRSEPALPHPQPAQTPIPPTLERNRDACLTAQARPASQLPSRPRESGPFTHALRQKVSHAEAH